MLKCCSLYSGSTGNSFFVQTEKTKILIDAGVSCRKIETALKTLQVSPNEINAILVTHEHIDQHKKHWYFIFKIQYPNIHKCQNSKCFAI